MTAYRLLMFDRDGTLTYENTDFHRDLSILPSYPFSAFALQKLKKAGFLVALVTNQSGIARGFWSMEQVDKLHHRLIGEWQIPMKVYMCPHHPDEKCACRKPSAGLLEKAMSDHALDRSHCLMIGDSSIDSESARAASIDFALVLTGRGKATHNRLPIAPTMTFDTVAQLSLQLINRQ